MNSHGIRLLRINKICLNIKIKEIYTIAPGNEMKEKEIIDRH